MWTTPASSAGPLSSAKPRFSPCCNGISSSDAPGATRVVKIDFKLPPVGEQIAVALTRSPETAEAREEEARMRLLEKQLLEARQKAGEARDQVLFHDRERLRLAASALDSGEGILSAIRIEGISEPVRADLQTYIPVHVGETLTKASIERITSAVRQFDEHLEIRFQPSGEGRSN